MEAAVAVSWLSRAGMVACMAVVVLFDLAVRLIPTRACRALAVFGALLQLSAQGAPGVAAGCANVAFVLAAAFTARALSGCALPHRARAAPAIGGGDVRCMAALALGSGESLLCGVAACCASALAAAAIARLRGKLLPGEPIPFAPHLAVWLGAVLASQLCGLAG